MEFLLQSRNHGLPWNKVVCSLLLLFSCGLNAQIVPNDPLFTSQSQLTKIKASEAWSIATGGETIQDDRIVIAVLDDGFDFEHPDLNFWVNANEIPDNGIDDDGNGYVDDYRGWNAVENNGMVPFADHGTLVAGIIGAMGNNVLGISGVNWDVGILPIRVSASTPSTVVAAYEYVLSLRRLYNLTNGQQGAFIVATNLSQSKFQANPDEYPAWCAIYDELGSEGILNVNGPENRHQEIGSAFDDLPALCPSNYLITVTSTTYDDQFLSNQWNNSGSPWSRTHIDMAAPGEDILSTSLGGVYSSGTGTSFAAPAVSGAIGLMFAAACDELISEYKSTPEIVAANLRQLLLNNTDPINALLPFIGYGRLNINRVLSALYMQKDEYLHLSGVVSSSGLYEVINWIETENYSFNSTNWIECKAGREIVLLPNTTLNPTGSGSFACIVDPVSFACSIPFVPVSVSLTAPDNAQCSSLIFCNASAFGGQPPYTYRWESRLASASNWTVHPQTSYLLVFNGNVNGDFYVRVRATDSRGTEGWSSEELVVCIDGMTQQVNDKLHSLAVEEKSIDEGNLSVVRAWVTPNPVADVSTVRIVGSTDRNVKGQIADCTGRIVKSVQIPMHMDRDVSYGDVDFSDLTSGWYYLWISHEGAMTSTRFVVVR